MNWSGGALFIHSSSSVSWCEETSFVNNTADVLYGGAIFVIDNSDLPWSAKTFFMDNRADFGGAVFAEIGF